MLFIDLQQLNESINKKKNNFLILTKCLADHQNFIKSNLIELYMIKPQDYKLIQDKIKFGISWCGSFCLIESFLKKNESFFNTNTFSFHYLKLSKLKNAPVTSKCISFLKFTLACFHVIAGTNKVNKKIVHAITIFFVENLFSTQI